jgi:hypothetical protein
MNRLRNNQSEMTPPDATFQFTPRHTRRILCLFPEYAWSFGTFNYAFPLMGSVKAFMPPQGLPIAALGRPWEVRFIDENAQPPRRGSALPTSCSLPCTSAGQIRHHRAHRASKSVVLGGRRPLPRPNGIPKPTLSTAGKRVTPPAGCLKSSTAPPAGASRNRSSSAPLNACR